MEAADRDRLRTVCAEVFGVEPEELEPDTDFFDDLNADRDELADVLVAVEDAFQIGLEAGISTIRTFEDLEALVDDELG